MNLLLAASHLVSFEPRVSHAVLDQIRLKEPDLILLRRPLKEPPAEFESEVAHWAHLIGIPFELVPPEEGGGRGATFSRDVALVARADAVVTYFLEGEEMTGGTAHLVEKAMDQTKPVEAFVFRAKVWDPFLLGNNGSHGA